MDSPIVTPSHRTHGLMISLLIGTVVISASLVAFLVITLGDTVNNERLAISCQNAVSPTLTQGFEKLSDACGSPDGSAQTTVATVHIVTATTLAGAATERMSFSYPNSWILADYSLPNVSDPAIVNKSYKLTLPGEKVFSDTALKSPVTIDIKTIDATELAAFYNFEAYVNSLYTGNGYSNLKIAKSTKNKGLLFTVTGLKEIGTNQKYPFEALVFQGSTQWVRTEYTDVDLDGASKPETKTNDGWAGLKQSLNFSTIK